MIYSKLADAYPAMVFNYFTWAIYQVLLGNSGGSGFDFLFHRAYESPNEEVSEERTGFRLDSIDEE